MLPSLNLNLKVVVIIKCSPVRPTNQLQYPIVRQIPSEPRRSPFAAIKVGRTETEDDGGAESESESMRTRSRNRS